ncbi:MAG: sugar transferase [Labrys sp. (in: a-proteobacteria)]
MAHRVSRSGFGTRSSRFRALGSVPVADGVRRSMDIGLALLGLALMAPVLLIAILALRLEGGGPVLFRQWRGGAHGQPFRIWKLRTLSVTEDGEAVRQVTRSDPRLTPVGAILRRLSIDEAPQLVNVLRGEMALVGPRPHPIALDRRFGAMLPAYRRRFAVRPGMTGWAQVSGDRGPVLTLGAMAHRLEADLWYVDNRSWHLDARILLRTIPVVLRDAIRARPS